MKHFRIGETCGGWAVYRSNDTWSTREPICVVIDIRNGGTSPQRTNKQSKKLATYIAKLLDQEIEEGGEIPWKSEKKEQRV